MTKPLHETQPKSVRVGLKADYINPQLQELQQIHSGGPIRNAELSSLPLPIRYFGYFFFTSATLMLLVDLLIQFLK
ncbi:hypothetical protein [Paenibacillus sp. UNC451MF]|uniref:hypothetical protein n=1 Tax=Paenibacillus sp. UNC451MF TaxID=1449063 RepID=UPI0004908699|nr:hypothetical protein [Paenibacillus sp. UNC451MF]